jgi:hypothetical protein
MVIFLHNSVFSAMINCSLVETYVSETLLPSSFILETETDSRFLQNVGKFLPHHTCHLTAFNKILRLFDREILSCLVSVMLHSLFKQRLTTLRCDIPIVLVKITK